MILTKLELTNFKGFQHATIEFDPKLNVIVGKNGAGKSSILEAIVKCFYSLTSRYISSGHTQNLYQVSEYDINHKSNCTKVKLDLYDKDQIFNGEIISLLTTAGYLSQDDEILLTENSNLKNQYIQNLKNKIEKGAISIPVIKLYPASRTNTSSIQSNNSVLQISQLEPWLHMIHNSISQNSFFNWIYEIENKELRKQKDDPLYVDPLLEPIRKAILSAFEILNGATYKLISESYQRVGTNTFIPTIALKNIQTGIKEILQQKSEGEKALIILIADIVYTLAISAVSENINILERTAIIMIDEVDTHLHPNWQRKVLGVLRKIFPNIQLIVTTHSPQVISSVHSENIISLDNYSVNKIGQKTYGFDTNNVLNNIFDEDERPTQITSIYKKFNAALSNNESIETLTSFVDELKEIDKEDSGNGKNPIIEEMLYQIEAYKFDLKNESDK